MIKFNIKELLAQKNYEEGKKTTIGDVAKAVGISRVTLYRMANSRGKFSTKTEYVGALCLYFGCGPGDLMTVTPDPDQPEGPAGGDAGDGGGE